MRTIPPASMLPITEPSDLKKKTSRTCNKIADFLLFFFLFIYITSACLYIIFTCFLVIKSGSWLFAIVWLNDLSSIASPCLLVLDYDRIGLFAHVLWIKTGSAFNCSEVFCRHLWNTQSRENIVQSEHERMQFNRSTSKPNNIQQNSIHTALAHTRAT